MRKTIQPIVIHHAPNWQAETVLWQINQKLGIKIVVAMKITTIRKWEDGKVVKSQREYSAD